MEILELSIEPQVDLTVVTPPAALSNDETSLRFWRPCLLPQAIGGQQSEIEETNSTDDWENMVSSQGPGSRTARLNRDLPHPS